MLEAALRQYLGVEVLERVWSRGDLSDDEAIEIAYLELDTARRERSAPDG